jgi:hypothetical protein
MSTMTRNMDRVATKEDWLEKESPEVYHMLRAFDGDKAALDWLRAKSTALYLFTRGVAGDRKAAAALAPDHRLDLDDLFGLICHDDLLHWLEDRHPDLQLLFAGIKGDDNALRRLRRQKAALARIAEGIRDRYEAYRTAPPEEPSLDGEGMTAGAAADVGCLIGEAHLSRGDFEKAVEAFSRSIEGMATADACEGRARAYRALAERDEHRARELRLQAQAQA